MKLTIPQAIIGSALLLSAAGSFIGWTAFQNHRFVQVDAQRGLVLDSRTGCTWRMLASPPTRVCPGDTQSHGTASLADIEQP